MSNASCRDSAVGKPLSGLGRAASAARAWRSTGPSTRSLPCPNRRRSDSTTGRGSHGSSVRASVVVRPSRCDTGPSSAANSESLPFTRWSRMRIGR